MLKSLIEKALGEATSLGNGPFDLTGPDWQVTDITFPKGLKGEIHVENQRASGKFIYLTGEYSAKFRNGKSYEAEFTARFEFNSPTLDRYSLQSYPPDMPSKDIKLTTGSYTFRANRDMQRWLDHPIANIDAYGKKNKSAMIGKMEKAMQPKVRIFK